MRLSFNKINPRVPGANFYQHLSFLRIQILILNWPKKKESEILSRNHILADLFENEEHGGNEDHLNFNFMDYDLLNDLENAHTVAEEVKIEPKENLIEKKK